MTAIAGSSNFRFLKSNCLNKVTPKIMATIQKTNVIGWFLFSIFRLLVVKDVSSSDL